MNRPPRTSNKIAAEPIHAAGPQRLACVGSRRRPRGVALRTNPSCSSDLLISFHTRGLGSTIGTSSFAHSAMYFRSATRSEHVLQVRRCSSCSAFPPVSMMYGRTFWNSAHVINPLSPIPFPSFRSSSLPAGLFGSGHFEKVAQLHACFVQLRLAVADGTSHHLGNLVVFVAFNVVQHKNDAVARRQALDGAFQVHAVNRTRQNVIPCPDVLLGPVFLGLHALFQGDFRQALFAQVHQHYVDREPVQPRGKGGLSPECRDLAIQLQESFLGEVLGFGGVAGHPQAEGINPALVEAVKSLKGLCVTALGPVNRLSFGEPRDERFLCLCQFAFSGRIHGMRLSSCSLYCLPPNGVGGPCCKWREAASGC